MIAKLALTAAAALFLAAPASANELSPVFGKAKVAKISDEGAKSVVGKGSTSQYYAYYANYYNAVAGYYGNISYVNDVNGYSSSYTYYYAAYQYASSAASYYYAAYSYKISE